MKIPKYIEKALDRRASAAEQYLHYDHIVSHWIEENNVMAEDYDYFGGVESIVNPRSSQARLREAILRKE